MNLNADSPEPLRNPDGSRRDADVVQDLPTSLPFEPIAGMLHEKVPSYEECVRLCLDHVLKDSSKKVREEMEELVDAENLDRDEAPPKGSPAYDGEVGVRIA